jgi:hypothetical protein
MFITVFLILYSLLHLYFYIRLKRATDLKPVFSLGVIVLLLFMVFSPIFIHLTTKAELFLPAKILSAIGYTWMGALFLFFSIHIAADLCRAIVYLANHIFSHNLLKYLPSIKTMFVVALLVTSGIVIYGRFEAENIRIERIVFQTAKLPPRVTTLRIVQLSDIHFSTLNGTMLARKIGKMVEDLHPDVLVSTGDLIDRGLEDKEGVAAVFRNIKTPYGKYAITGNHEFISGIREALVFMEMAGFRILRNEGIQVGGVFNVAGIDDSAAGRFGIELSRPESSALKGFSPGRLNILLKHRPEIAQQSAGKFDIQISGHTHNGQIFPFTLITRLFYPYSNGLFRIGKHGYLYVSRGTGTWGPPIRFLTFPEITVIDFRREGGKNTLQVVQMEMDKEAKD